jgi:uncharacterized membrane protein YfcA
MSQLVGYALALAIGVTLGMLGGGGSILTVPVFVYVMGFEAKDAIAMSLPVVGTTSLVGAVGHWRAGNLDSRAVTTFAPPAMLGALGGARLASVVSGTFQLVLLAAVMIAAGLLMLREGGRLADDGGSLRPGGAVRRLVLAATGLAVGVLTGLVGVGGGFLIVPALVLLAGVPIRRAIGASLVVISLSTLTGLAAHHGQVTISWDVVALFTMMAVVGTVAGTRAARHVPPAALRRAFGLLVLVLAAFILFQNRAAAQQNPPGTVLLVPTRVFDGSS